MKRKMGIKKSHLSILIDGLEKRVVIAIF